MGVSCSQARLRGMRSRPISAHPVHQSHYSRAVRTAGVGARDERAFVRLVHERLPAAAGAQDPRARPRAAFRQVPRPAYAGSKKGRNVLRWRFAAVSIEALEDTGGPFSPSREAFDRSQRGPDEATEPGRTSSPADRRSRMLSRVVGETDQLREALAHGGPSTEATACQYQTDHAIGVTTRELEARAAPCRERDHDGTIDPEVVEQQGIRVRLIRGVASSGSVEPKYPKREGPITRNPGREGWPPGCDGIDVAAKDPM